MYVGSIQKGWLQPGLSTGRSLSQAKRQAKGSSLPLFLQPKLAISRPGDPAEVEADRVADQVMRMREPVVQRQCAACEEEEAVTVSRKAQGAIGSDAPASVGSVIGSPGQPLASSARAFFEPRFGQDLSHVRVHTDGGAQQSAQDVNALAYTVGPHVVFDAGRYAPEAPDGQRLLAHELTHVVQQDGVSSKHETAGHIPEPYVERPFHVARQDNAVEKNAETDDEPVTDVWGGTVVTEVLISLARRRVGFNTDRGMLLGTVDTDLPVGRYTIWLNPSGNRWVVEGPGVKAGVRFKVDLSEAKADPWTLHYPGEIALTVSAGALGEPKTFGDMLNAEQGFTDPLWIYEEWGGNIGPAPPVSGLDDYETIEYVNGSPPHYRVKYRDGTEKLLTYAELTPAMLKQMKRFFDAADMNFVLFVEETFPMWWFIVGTPMLVPMQGAGARPYIPKRVPLSPPDAVPVGEPPGSMGAVVKSGVVRPGAPAAGGVVADSVMIPLISKPSGPGVAYGQQAASRLAAQGKTGGAIIRPLIKELNGQTQMTPLEKATAMQVACNSQGKTFGAGPIAKMSNGDLVVTPRAPNPSAPVVVVRSDGTVARGNASVELVGNSMKVSKVSVE
jgi:hypothetical protein